MNQKKDLFEAASIMEDACCSLRQIYTAFHLLDTDMEEGGYQREDCFDENTALIFAANFPAYLSTFRVVCRDLDRVIIELLAHSEEMYAEARKERVEHEC